MGDGRHLKKSEIDEAIRDYQGVINLAGLFTPQFCQHHVRGALISFHEAGFFRELQWKRIKHDKMDEKAVDGWFQFDYVLDLAKGTETQYIVIG